MSEREDSIIIMDEVSLMRRRIAGLLMGSNIHVYEVANSEELFSILLDEDSNVRLVIMELGFDINAGFETLARIKDKKPNIPIFIITSNNKRQTFIRSMAEGAADYILKPFDDEILQEKMLSVLKIKREILSDEVHISFSLLNYLKAEFLKAKKGNFEVTVLMCTLYDLTNESSNIMENKYLRAIDQFYANMKNNLWDTDIFEYYGSQTFIGVFPYCTAANVDIIQHKTMDYFNSVVMNNTELSNLQLAFATITYPMVEMEPKVLLMSLGKHIDKLIAVKKKEEEMKNYYK